MTRNTVDAIDILVAVWERIHHRTWGVREGFLWLLKGLTVACPNPPFLYIIDLRTRVTLPTPLFARDAI